MKITFSVLIMILPLIVDAQKVSGLWIPVKRIEQVDKLKFDRCDSINEFPFQKIKFIGDNKVSLFGFDAPDPDVSTMVSRGNGSWRIENSVFHTLYPEFIKGSTVILKIKNDTLYTYLIKGSDTLFQKFIRKYLDVNFTSYSEIEIGNLLLRGKYIKSDIGDTIQFHGSGKITMSLKNRQKEWGLKFFKFRYYSKECNTYTPDRVVELTSAKGNKKLYLVKSTSKGFDFYAIKNMKDPGTAGDIIFSFSLIRI